MGRWDESAGCSRLLGLGGDSVLDVDGDVGIIIRSVCSCGWWWSASVLADTDEQLANDLGKGGKQVEREKEKSFGCCQLYIVG
ncbi:hypothetical protein BpHYR1_003063 [Brachionus plicatilis]|uniref:Uncharacterized protein n=1 Tax=Brachionus plicatilis TaxID=10195 RepID=A0A3M7SEU2_BRAPC|nr:hypothetical protein BpHYR1_003063 [Brachionus plicatilis]